MTTQQLYLFNGLYLAMLVIVAILTRGARASIAGCLPGLEPPAWWESASLHSARRGGAHTAIAALKSSDFATAIVDSDFARCILLRIEAVTDSRRNTPPPWRVPASQVGGNIGPPTRAAGNEPSSKQRFSSAQPRPSPRKRGEAGETGFVLFA